MIKIIKLSINPTCTSFQKEHYFSSQNSVFAVQKVLFSIKCLVLKIHVLKMARISF